MNLSVCILSPTTPLHDEAAHSMELVLWWSQGVYHRGYYENKNEYK